ENTAEEKATVTPTLVNSALEEVYEDINDDIAEPYSPTVVETLTRYSAVIKRPLSLMEKIAAVAAMMKKDDETPDSNLDHYAEIFYNYPSQPGWTLELVQLFFVAGISAQFPQLATSLLLRCINNHNPGSHLYSHAEFFVSMYANVNYQGTLEKNPDKFTLLHYAIWRENIDIALAIVTSPNSSIDYTLQDSKGRTVLVLAANMRHVTLLEAMLKDPRAIAALNIPDYNQRTALHYSYLLGSSIMVNTLLKTQKVDTNMRDVTGKLPHQLLHASSDEITKVLNAVSIDERRFSLAVRNYFQLTYSVPMMTPPIDLGIIPTKFAKDGSIVPEAKLANITGVLNILNCAANLSYVNKIWNRLLTVGVGLIPEKVRELWQSQQYFLAAIPQETLLQACINGQRYMLDQQLRSSFLSPNIRLFTPVQMSAAKEAVSAIVITPGNDPRKKQQRTS
ncbi:MAG: ankyrin repeat domain-containing protein, partial [Pseudomonadota bacterium]